MAVYQGTRLRTGALPAAEAPAHQRRSAAPASVSTTQRVRPMGLLMAAIVATTILGLVYLTQTLGTNATSYEIRVLQGQRAELMTAITRYQIEALDATQPGVIIRKARELKLKKLDPPVILSAP